MAKPAKNASASSSKSIAEYFSRKPATRSKSANSDGQTKEQQKLASDASCSPSKSLTGALPEKRTRMRTPTPETNGLSGSVPSETDSAIILSSVPVPPTPLSPPDNSMKKNEPWKNTQLSSPESCSSDEVPGSVSGEEEMEYVGRVRPDVTALKDSVAKWRNESLSLSIMPNGMDVVEVTTSEPDRDRPFYGAERTTPPPFQQQLTPPPTTGVDQQTFSPIPKPIDTAKKTEILIAEIKAKALAAAKFSPIEEVIPFKETLSDSDDDLRPLEISVKGKGKTKEIAAPISTPYYNTRSTNVKSKMISPTVLQSERRQAANKKKHNPFIALLKEKREEERSGRSDLDYIKAAATILPKSQLLLEMNEEDEYDDFGSPSQKTAASMGREVDGMRVVVDDDDRQLFGDQSEDIKDILDGERKNIRAEERRQIEVGVQFWRDDTSSIGDDVVMDVETTLDFGEYNKIPVLRRLHDALKADDQSQAIAILDSTSLSMVNLQGFPGVINYLAYLALSPSNIKLSSAAFKALRNIWTTARGFEPGITLQSILNAVSRLGAKSEFFHLSEIKPPNLDPEKRESLIFRLVKLLESSARPRLLNMNEIPEIVLVLLAISLDPSTATVLQNAITVALDAIFQSIADPNVVDDIEPVICTKILSYIQRFEPFNISRTVTFLTGSAGRSTRVARWVARSVLLGKTRVTESEYCHTPAVQDLSAILVQGATTACQVFQIKHDTDYVDLGHYVRILAVALTDIPSYFPSEIAATAAIKAEHVVQRSPNKDKIETPLEHLNRCITSMQRKITDIGTDIERVRTKAALHHLSMRIHYQLATRKPDKSPVISAYFEKRNPGTARSYR
ncbi:hypothetical protein J3R30DRAFT_1767683 [Lentinula aciculospora]|uniref:Uncharacterized protein n=1 Tax=Lentinula aciculospora TaxID=153920 RepID=A0A9W9AI59_9AGAR|nr:hypothetical protein J3R30DRAFT_1767683 [Lentinula aciculospora]